MKGGRVKEEEQDLMARQEQDNNCPKFSTQS